MNHARKTIIKVVGGILFTGTLIVGSFMIGRISEQGSETENIVSKSTVENKGESVETDQIAIVNMDSGINIKEERINYAAKLLGNLKENFMVTGLEDARQGLSDGKYGAYIIIPSMFSENVNSLNHTPTKTQIEYNINTELNAESKEEVIFDTVAFMNELNHDLSYMYINSILKEFHNTQDAVATVMENDVTDRDVILKIQPYDLMELVAVPELKQTEVSQEQLEIQKYIAKNEELVSTINDQYTGYIALSKTDYETLSQEGKNLLTEWGMMETTINDINLTQDENGEIVYEQGVQSANEFLNTYNTTLLEEKDKLSDSAGISISALEEIKSLHEKNIEDYNQAIIDNKTQAEDILNIYNIPNIYAENGYLVIGTTMVNIEKTSNENADNTNKAKMALWMLEDYVKWSSEYIAALEAVVPAESQGILTTYNPDTELLSELGYNSWYGEDALTGMQTAAANHYISDSLDTGQPDLIEVNMEKLAADISSAINSNMTSTEDYKSSVQSALSLFSLFEDNVTIDNESGKTETTITELLSSAIDHQTQTIKQLGEIGAIENKELQDIVENNIVLPLVNKTETAKNSLLIQYDHEKEQFNTYDKLFSEYDPLAYINQSEIQGTVTQMQENGSVLQKDTDDFASEQRKYAENVYATTTENTTALMENVEEAKEKSNEAVSKGLSEAQSVKAENSTVNQALLQGITKKLPYTRLGNIEYTQAYEFIVNPLEITKKEVEEKATEAKEVSTGIIENKSLNTKEDSKVQIPNPILLLILAALIAVAVLLLSGRKTDKAKRGKGDDPWTI